MVHSFISGFCDEVKESSWIENDRKRFLCHITDGDTLMDAFDKFSEELN